VQSEMNPSDTELSYLEETDEPTGTGLVDIVQQVSILKGVLSIVDETETVLSQLKEKARHLSEEVIPQMFDTNNITYLQVHDDSGEFSVSIKEDVKASLPKEDPIKRLQALDWLSNHGGGEMIVDTVTMENPTIAVIDRLNEEGVDYSRKQDVNSTSLAAWFREKLGIKKGTIPSLDRSELPTCMNVYAYRKTVLK
jgi:hypothetical protein